MRKLGSVESGNQSLCRSPSRQTTHNHSHRHRRTALRCHLVCRSTMCVAVQRNWSRTRVIQCCTCTSRSFINRSKRSSNTSSKSPAEQANGNQQKHQMHGNTCESTRRVNTAQSLCIPRRARMFAQLACSERISKSLCACLDLILHFAFFARLPCGAADAAASDFRFGVETEGDFLST